MISNDYLSLYGVCATTIIKYCLDSMKIENGYYIPNRFFEGYGISVDICEKAIAKNYDLIITVDNGIVAKEAIKFCREHKIDLIITDHHEMQDELDYDYLLHPRLMEREFCYSCGAMLALQIAFSLIKPTGYLVILAAIATIADMMILFEENRKLVRLAIKFLNSHSYTQFELLLDRKINYWNEDVIAFNIAPKINAIGRLADRYNINSLVQYFLNNNIDQLRAYAYQLKQVNQQRRNLSKCDVTNEIEILADKFNLVINKELHQGVIGLIAANVMRTNGYATLVMCENRDLYKGSARSNGDIDLMELFAPLKNVLFEFGGHKQACGLAVKKENLDQFKVALVEQLGKYEFHEIKNEFIEISLHDIDIQDLIVLESLRPFGQGFKIPDFKLANFEVVDKVCLKNQYPKWYLKDGEFQLEAISFKLTKKYLDKPINSFIGNLELNEYLGKKRCVMNIKSIE